MAQKTEHLSELEQRLRKREQEGTKLGREDEADYPGLASLFKESGLYQKIDVELLKRVKLRNTIIGNVFRKFQDSYQIENGSKATQGIVYWQHDLDSVGEDSKSWVELLKCLDVRIHRTW